MVSNLDEFQLNYFREVSIEIHIVFRFQLSYLKDRIFFYSDILFQVQEVFFRVRVIHGMIDSDRHTDVIENKLFLYITGSIFWLYGWKFRLQHLH